MLADEMASNAIPGPRLRHPPNFPGPEAKQSSGMVHLLGDTLQSIFFGVWRTLVPGTLRVAVYKILARIGELRYGRSDSSAV